MSCVEYRHRHRCLVSDTAVCRPTSVSRRPFLPTLHSLPGNGRPYCCIGIRCIDATVPLGRAHRLFRCRCILLYWTGDYPAQALVSGTHSKTCHWCTLKSEAAPEVTRRCWGGYRAFLPEDHPMRAATSYWPLEDGPCPEVRPNESFAADGVANEAHEADLRLPDARKRRIFKKDLPYKTTGVKCCSPLSFLPLWHMTWDILADMMHIITGIFKRHICALLAGKRVPAAVKARKRNSPGENRALAAAHKKCKEIIKTWTLSKVIHRCTQ